MVLYKATVSKIPQEAISVKRYGDQWLHAQVPASQFDLKPLQEGEICEWSPMQAGSQLNHIEVLAIQLEVLRQEHRDLDLAISVLAEKGIDQLAVKQLKKKNCSSRIKLPDAKTNSRPILLPNLPR